jgi:hypothetical protein
MESGGGRRDIGEIIPRRHDWMELESKHSSWRRNLTRSGQLGRPSCLHVPLAICYLHILSRHKAAFKHVFPIDSVGKLVIAGKDENVRRIARPSVMDRKLRWKFFFPVCNRRYRFKICITFVKFISESATWGNCCLFFGKYSCWLWNTWTMHVSFRQAKIRGYLYWFKGRALEGA